MKISLIDNGLDSIKKGYSYLKEYESFISSESSDNSVRFSILKDAILSLQHGIEILFKCVLLNTNEILLFSEINEKIRSAYKQRRAGEITSLFEAKGVHTVTHKEAMLRSSDICGHAIDEKFRSQLEKLEKWRNSITHSAVFLNENEVSSVMSKLLYSIDNYFGSILGDEYLKGRGKIGLEIEFKKYLSLNGPHESSTKSIIVQRLISALSSSGISADAPGSIYTEDPEKAFTILSSMQGDGISYGADLINMHSSGKVTVHKSIKDSSIILHAEDIDVEYHFEFSSLVAFIPPIAGKSSPMIFLYGKKATKNGKSPIISSFNGYDTQEGIRFKNSDTFEWNEKDVYRLKYEEEENYEDEYNYDQHVSELPNSEPWVSVFRFLSAGCVCFMNIQTLNYGQGKNIIYNSKISAKDLHEQMVHAAERMRSNPAISKD